MTPAVQAADLFCGAGGTSRGLRRACTKLGRRLELTAINHWPTAVDTHRKNEPAARHICERLEGIEPRRVIPDGHLDLLVASPECRHHSRARGGRPTSDQQRASAWSILRWAETLYVRTMVIENVPEFSTWGPVNRHGQPIRHRAGETYRAFLSALRSLGYRVDTRVLTAADYGDPTTRRRLFVVADRERRPEWPSPTHAPRTEARRRGLQAWRGAREVIDWSVRGESIFRRRKPLAAATLRRIESGLERFGAGAAKPFLVVLRNHAAARDINEPVPTITTSGAHMALCEPFLLAQQSGGVARRIGEPAPTVTTGGAISLVQPFVFANRTHNAPKRVSEPVPTLCTGNHIALVEPDAEGRHEGGRVDIRFRMLLPHELAQAQGFEREHEFCGTKADQVRQIGNAVPVATAEALCRTALER